MANHIFKDGKPVEIERKYLIKMPDVCVLECQPNYGSSRIEQAYIKGDGVHKGGRIRKRQFEKECRYYKTFKEDLEGISRIEIESEISESEYNELMKNKLEDTRVIKKVRHCFEFDGKLMELDIYDFWDDTATLEVELTSERERVNLPHFIEVIKDVSEDEAYRNFSLAKGTAEYLTAHSEHHI